MVGGYWSWMMAGDMREHFKIMYFMVRELFLMRIVYMLEHFKMENVMVKGL